MASKVLRRLYGPSRQFATTFANCPIPETDKSLQGDQTETSRANTSPGSNSNSARSSQRTLHDSSNDRTTSRNNVDSDPEKGSSQKLLVSFQDTPSEDPRQWPFRKKAILTLQVTVIALQVTFASSVSSSAVMSQVQEFGIAQEVSALSTAVFLAGVGLGGIPFAPLSEAIGRHPIYIGTLIATSLFEIGAATAQNSWTLIICRFFAGFFAATPLSCAGGTLVDIWSPEDRAWAFPFFAAASFAGPSSGPLIGGYLAMNASWRWNYHIIYITGLALALYCAIFCYESLSDEILRKKAAYFRKRTGDQRWQAPNEKIPLGEVYKSAFTKVIKMFFTEPQVFFNTIYLSVVYFCLFGFLEGYPVIFGEQHGFNNGEVGLAFIPIIVGIYLTFPVMFWFGLRYRRKAKELSHAPPPEEHFLPMMIGGPILSMSLMWLAWTSYSSVSYWAPLMAGVPFGLGILMVFISCYQNTIESYGSNAASALGALVLVRYLVSSGAVEATTPMYHAMQSQWALFMLAMVSIALIPVSVLFYRKGASIRQRSPFAIKD